MVNKPYENKKEKLHPHTPGSVSRGCPGVEVCKQQGGSVRFVVLTAA